MATVTDNILYSYFETGDKPTQQQFRNLIDSKRNVLDKIGLGDLTEELYALVSAGDTNLGNSDLTLSSDRYVTGDGFGLYFENLTETKFSGNQFVLNDYATGSDYLYASNDTFYKQSYVSGINGYPFEITSSGDLYVRSMNGGISDFYERFRIFSNDDIVESYFINSNFSVKDNSANRWLFVDTPNMATVIGDVENNFNKTQLGVFDWQKQLWFQAREGVVLYACDALGSNPYYAILKTDNVNDGFVTLQMPRANGRTFGVSVNGNYADANGNMAVSIPTVPTLATGAHAPAFSNSSNLTSINSADCRYVRQGNTVMMFGTITVALTSSSSSAYTDMDLPIASTLGGNDVSGVGSCGDVSGVTMHTLVNNATNKIRLRIRSSVTSTVAIGYALSYKIN